MPFEILFETLGRTGNVLQATTIGEVFCCTCNYHLVIGAGFPQPVTPERLAEVVSEIRRHDSEHQGRGEIKLYLR